MKMVKFTSVSVFCGIVLMVAGSFSAAVLAQQDAAKRGQPAAAAKPLTGAGTSTMADLMTAWVSAYAKESNVKVGYNVVGAAAGVKQAIAREVDFGVSDNPISNAEAEKNGIVQFPMIVGGMIPVANVPGLAKDARLRLTAAALADIYLGKITKWNHPDIAAHNADVKLPDLAIAVFHRADPAGTTAVFTRYLARTHEQFRKDVGVGTMVKWKVGKGEIGANNVAKAVLATAGGIGFLDYAAFLRNKGLIAVELRNLSARFMAPDSYSIRSAADSPNWLRVIPEMVARDSITFDLTDTPGITGYPLVTFTYVLMPKAPADPQRARAVLQFFNWAFGDAGGVLASGIGLSPLPDAVRDGVRGMLKQSVKDASGTPVWQ